MKLPNLPRITKLQPVGSGSYTHENGDVAFLDTFEKLQRKYIREASSDKRRRKSKKL